MSKRKRSPEEKAARLARHREQVERDRLARDGARAGRDLERERDGLIRAVRRLRNGGDGDDGLVGLIRDAYGDPADTAARERVKGLVRKAQEDEERRRREERERREAEQSRKERIGGLHDVLYRMWRSAIDLHGVDFNLLDERLDPIREAVDDGRITGYGDLYRAVSDAFSSDRTLLEAIPLGSTLTGRLANISLKRGEWLERGMFRERVFSGGVAKDGEDTPPSLVGTAAEVLVRAMEGALGEDDYRHARAGARISGRSDDFPQAVSGLSSGDVMVRARAAFTLASFESFYRSPKESDFRDPTDTAMRHITRMAADTARLFGEYGGVERIGFDIPWNALTDYVSKADGDFTTPGVVWDLKVHVRPPEGRHLLQILCYWIMLTAADETDPTPYHSIGIANPRLGKMWIARIGALPPRVIRNAAIRIVGYHPLSDQYRRVHGIANRLHRRETERDAGA